MGQTLTNEIYLPAEGERNCYEGLAANWTALDGLIGGYNVHISNTTIHVTAEDKNKWDAVTSKADASALTAHTGDTTIHVTSADKQAWNGHVADTTIHVTSADKQAWNGKADNSALTAHTGDTTIHVTAADKEAWDGKADASALTAHTGNTTIHVTAADKNTWDAVTTKANDADAVHKSGAETIAGLKTFSDLMSINGDYLGNEASTNQRTNLQLRSNRDTAGKSSAYITRFRQNRSQGGMQPGDSQKIGFDIMENETRTNNVFDIQCTGWNGDVPTQVNLASSVTSYSFGSSNNPCKINNMNPGSLSLPDLTAGVDISGYITLGSYQQDTYTPPSDGYISIMIYGTSANGLFVYSGSFGAGMRSIGGHPTYGQVSVICLPVRAGTTYTIENTGATNIGWAKFYPCTGNV